MKLFSRRRGWASRAVTLIAAVAAAVVLAPTAAHAGADPWSTTKWAGCSKTWNYNQYGATGQAHFEYDAYRATTRKYVIEWSHNWVDNMFDCGPKGDTVRANRIKVTTEFRFSGTNLSCGVIISWPPGFECTVSGYNVVFRDSTECSTYVSYCRDDFGYMEVLAASGASFYNYVNARSTISLYRSDGSRYTWSTNYV